jgi:hypothetical protein
MGTWGDIHWPDSSWGNEQVTNKEGRCDRNESAAFSLR